MKTIHQVSVITLMAIVLLGLGGCSSMSTQNENATADTEAGAIDSAILTESNAAETVGGSAVMGVIGHEISK
ncbi:hypothetical protein [Candidatus Nitrotoga sp. M5]|uniref:hypothetical protein n=1 Tax=Candidatus Nitrotoga sp. M5 TaxID=2890409 RepID=UPI001EF67AC6|nr:hypothetical protein [Candidatus Nitrotoga sp. M5]CAH1388226.1 Osmotically inducible lipoprotein OsmB [Candidatus Nitrotoga sp. M5]